MVAGFLDTALDDVSAVSQSTNREAKPPQFTQVGAAQVPKFHPVEVSPDAIIGVEIRGATRKALRVNTLDRAARQVVLDGHDQAVGDLSQIIVGGPDT